MSRKKRDRQRREKKLVKQREKLQRVMDKMIPPGGYKKLADYARGAITPTPADYIRTNY